MKSPFGILPKGLLFYSSNLHMVRYIRILVTLCLFLCIEWWNIWNIWTIVYAQEGNFEFSLEESISIEWTPTDIIDIDQRLSDWAIDIGWWEELRDFIVWVAVKIIIPVFVFAWIIIAIIWFYKLMWSDNDEEQKKAFNYLLRWVVGIVLMVSAWFITNQLVGTGWDSWILWSIGAPWNSEAPAWAVIAEQLYTKIVFPLLQIFIYFVLWILFLMAMIHAFQYIFSKDEEFQKKPNNQLSNLKNNNQHSS